MRAEAYSEMASTEAAHWWFCGRRQILSSVIAGLDLPAEPRIIEMGAGTGGNLAMLQRFGHVSAMEMDSRARTFARAKTRGSIDIREGKLPDQIPFEGETFDLVCLFDVLEHVEEDAGTLRALSPLLKSNGYLVITVPAYPWLWGPHDETLHHKRRYDRRQLESLLLSTGYQILRQSFFNTLLFPLVLLVRIKERLMRDETAQGSRIPWAPINVLFRYLFALERFLILRTAIPFGASLLVVAQRTMSN